MTTGRIKKNLNIEKSILEFIFGMFFIIEHVIISIHFDHILGILRLQKVICQAIWQSD